MLPTLFKKSTDTVRTKQHHHVTILANLSKVPLKALKLGVWFFRSLK